MTDSTVRPELLSPAGDAEALRAAVANGANAVYFGLSDFNARHRATNFTLESLPETMQFLHEHGVRGYVTFNTLIFSDELPRAVEYLTAIIDAGADAVIVQDLGIARLIKKLAPAFAVHGSTQMTLSEARGIEFVRQLGVERVILARELSAADIGAIAGSTSMPLEVFIHGALCVAYSGQCLTSESFGGRSANRGQCAQACRQPYELIVDGAVRDLGEKAYLLSPQDLAAYDLIADLAELGVCSFKIEGRLKSPQYVAATTQTYRAAIDACREQKPFSLSAEEQRDLAQSFSRGFTHGFFDGVNHQELVAGRFPKHRGVQLGTVIDQTARGVLIELAPAGGKSNNGSFILSDNLPVKPGDGLVFDEGHPEQDEQGGRVFSVELASLSHGLGKARRLESSSTATTTTGTLVEITFWRNDINLAAISPGSRVWKTDDPELRRRLERSYSRTTRPRTDSLDLQIHGVDGEPLKVTVTDDAGRQASVFSDTPVQTARKHPLSEDVVREQFGRLGETPFTLRNVELTGDLLPTGQLGVMVPKSVMNDLRRRAVAALLALRDVPPRPVVHAAALAELRETARQTDLPAVDVETAVAMTVLVRSPEQFQAVLDWQPPAGCARPAMLYCDFEEVRFSKTAVTDGRAAGLLVALATPRILKPGEEGLLQQILNCEPDAILVRNLAAIGYFQEQAPGLPLVGDYALNVANELTAALFAERGLSRLVPSYDLNLQQLQAMLGRISPELFEVVVHQHMPMFHMEHCVFAHTLSNGKDFHDCGRPCDDHRVELRDHVGESHPLVADVGCRNTVFNAQAQSAGAYVPQLQEWGVRRFRVELLRESAAETRALLDSYAGVLTGESTGLRLGSELRVLNQLGVVRGTLDFA